MKPELVKEDGRVFEINCEIEQSYLNPKYSLSKEVAVITSTGWLKILSVSPASGGEPSFVGRWDGGSRSVGNTERYDLDFDIHGVPKEERDWFKNGKHGYSGHHASRVSSAAGWEYEVFVTTPSGTIFKGFVRLHLHRKIAFSEMLRIGE